MSVATCPSCGAEAVPGASFCAHCGAALAWKATVLPSGVPPPAFPPSYERLGATAPGLIYPGLPGTLRARAPSTGPVERKALWSVQWAAVLALVGAVLSAVSLVGTDGSSVLGVSAGNLTLGSTGLPILLAISLAGLALIMAELLLYRSAFRRLAPVDSRFSTPAVFVLVFLVAVVLVTLLLVALFVELLPALSCLGAGDTNTSACLNVGALLALGIGVIVVGIVALIGYIGLLVGIWRLGTRYDDPMFKVGAVLLILPLVGIAGAVLILVAARAALRGLGTRPSPSGFG